MLKPPAPLPGLDPMRSLAAIAIVWLHTPETAELEWTTTIGRFAVPFFAASLSLLAFRHGERLPAEAASDYLASRVRRLYVPFLAWSGVYLAFRLAARLVFPASHQPLVGWNVLWTGTAHHLWFLPFALFASALAYAAGRLAARRPGPARLQALAWAIAGTTCAVIPRPASLPDYTLSLSYDALPAVLWACAWGACPPVRLAGRQLSRLGWLGLASGISLLLVAGRNRHIENVSGFMALLAGFGPAPAGLVRLLPSGRLAFGIYLSHILFVEGLQKVGHADGLAPAAWLDAVTFSLSLTLSAVTAAAIERVGSAFPTRWSRKDIR